MTAANIFISAIVLLIGLSACLAYPTKQDWPEECKDKSFCHIQPKYYPKETFAKLLKDVKFNFEQSGGVSNRSSEGDLNDIADCPSVPMFEKFYLILDDKDQVRFVAQNDDAFVFKIQIEECSEPGRTYSSTLDEDKLKKSRVDCFENRQPFGFPVLSLDGATLETVSPKGGLPFSCSAKVMTS